MSVPPKAPAVYKPTTPKIAGPPVYRPQQYRDASAQRKVQTNFRLETHPAPSGFRIPQHQVPSPQPVQRVSTASALRSTGQPYAIQPQAPGNFKSALPHPQAVQKRVSSPKAGRPQAQNPLVAASTPPDFSTLQPPTETVQMSQSTVVQPVNALTYKTKMKKKGRPVERMPIGAIKRKNFQRLVIVGVPVRRGQHRRHIISSHLMKMALEKWVAAHRDDGELEKLIEQHGTPQALHELLNNNIKNLIAGPGAENTAIGMFTNYVGRLVTTSTTSTTFSAREMRRKLRNPSGFQRDLQKRLTRSAVRIITKDPFISGSRLGLISYLKDLQDSTDFDWPADANPDLFGRWHEAYLGFWRIYNNPGDWNYEGLQKVVKDFLALPRPVFRF